MPHPPNPADPSRRQWNLALVALPAALSLAQVVDAKTNPPLRTSLKYQDTPGPEGRVCSGCLQFVPGAKPTDKGGCKAIAGDDEISPKGWCVAWVKKA